MPPGLNPTSVTISPLAQQIAAGRAQRQLPPGTTRPAPPQQLPRPSGIQAVQAVKTTILSQEITHSGGETTQEIDQLLRKSVKALRNSLVETAYFSFQLDSRDDWASLGFADGAEYAATGLGLNESTWETYLLLGERLSPLSLDQMRELSIAAARLITTISAKIWKEFDWLTEARILSSREFAGLVASRTKDLKLQGAGLKGLPEQSVKITVQIPASQQDRMEQRIESLRRARRLSSLSEALDLAMSAAEREPLLASRIEALAKASQELERVWEQIPVEQDIPEAVMTTQRLARRIERAIKDLVGEGLKIDVPDQIKKVEETRADLAPA